MKNLLTEVLAPRYTLPDGYDSWGLKSTCPDLTTRNGFRWPWPGGETPYLKLEDHNSPCPRLEGDGVCVALTWAGMAAGGFPARTLLLVAYRSSEARGDGTKLRVPQAFVVDVIDGERLLVSSGKNANLTRANLTRADLTGADLFGANLFGVNLTRADLTRANLTGANLTGANLSGANLTWANLSRANLTWAKGRGQ